MGAVTVVSLLGDRFRLKRMKHVLTVWGPGWSGETDHFQDGCAFPSCPSRALDPEPRLPRLPLCPARGSCDRRAGKGPRPPLGAGNQPHPGTGSERPV